MTPVWKTEQFRYVTSHILIVGGVYLGKVEEYDPLGYPGIVPAPRPTASVFAPEHSESAQSDTVEAGKQWCEQTIRALFLQTLDFAETVK